MTCACTPGGCLQTCFRGCEACRPHGAWGPLKPDQARLVILSCPLGIEEREGAQPWGGPQSEVGDSTEEKLRETELGAEDRATTHSFLHSFVHQMPLTLATASIVLGTSS